MCTDATLLTSSFTVEHMDTLKSAYADVPELYKHMGCLVRPMTNSLHPRVYAVVTVVDLVARYLSGERASFFGHGAFQRLSALSRTDALVRYRSIGGALERMHDAVLPFRMAERNWHLLNNSLKNHFGGLQLVAGCCCGAAIAHSDVDVHALAEFAQSNKVRSYADAHGEVREAPLKRLPTLADFSAEEVAAVTRIDALSKKILGYKERAVA
jgi:hypothetical protein